LPLHTPDTDLCGECLGRPPAFDAARVPFLYRPPVDELIAQLKYRGELPLGRLLARQLSSRVAGGRLDLLLPMPLHRTRLRQRGFNQAAELCRTLSRDTDTPWATDALVRVQAGNPQRGSSRRQRQRNVRNAFRWAAARPCPPRVALVDDVITTGATARAAATCLKRAGAEWVEVWAIARTPKGPGH
jgi:ComF family protein